MLNCGLIHYMLRRPSMCRAKIVNDIRHKLSKGENPIFQKIY